MGRTHKRIALLHHTGRGNLGDDAIIDVIVAKIRRRWVGAEIVVFSMNPDDTVKRHGVPSYPIRSYRWHSEDGPVIKTERPQFKLAEWFQKTRNPTIRVPRAAISELLWLVESYRMLKSFDLLIVSGGGQLTERGGPWSFPYALYVWGLMAKRAGVRLVFLNVGAGPLNHPLSKFFVVRALRVADYVSFRDNESQELIADLGFKGNGYVFPDHAYSLEVASSNVVAKDANRPVVGVAPMPFPFSDLLEYPSNAQAIQDELVDKMATFASLLVSQSYSINLFGSDIKADPPVIKDLQNILLKRYGISMREYVSLESVSELLSRMSTLDYVVTCRFHGVVFAHLLNKPVLAIAHHPKITHLMNALGLSKYCVDMRTFDPVQLMDTFAALVSETETVKKSMAASLAEYRQQLAAQWDVLFPTEAYMSRRDAERTSRVGTVVT
jgi:polysaccharide pyruvyl transferase WcaK-like protein